MTPPARLWARLTWQAKDVDALAADLSRRLGVPSRPGGLAPGARLLDLGTALLEVRPWVREGPRDHPRAAGRLMLEPVPAGEAAPGTAPAMTLAAVGWATVDADRAEDELGMWLGPRATDGPDADEPVLGARARVRDGGGLPGTWTVVLEPSTEGRAAASLARDGEGPCALYLRPAGGLDSWLAAAREAGIGAGRRRPGPLGDQVPLVAGPAGPHLIVTEGRVPPSPAPRPGTIRP